MANLQATEIELSNKKEKCSISKRRILAIISGAFLIIAIVVLTIIMANRASKAPELIQPTNPGTLPAQNVE